MCFMLSDLFVVITMWYYKSCCIIILRYISHVEWHLRHYETQFSITHFQMPHWGETISIERGKVEFYTAPYTICHNTLCHYITLSTLYYFVYLTLYYLMNTYVIILPFVYYGFMRCLVLIFLMYSCILLHHKTIDETPLKWKVVGVMVKVF